MLARNGTRQSLRPRRAALCPQSCGLRGRGSQSVHRKAIPPTSPGSRMVKSTIETHGHVPIHGKEHGHWRRCFGFPPNMHRSAISIPPADARKSWSTLHFSVVLDRSLLLRLRRPIAALSLRPDTVPDEPSFRTDGRPDFQEIPSAQTFNELKGSVHPGIRLAKLRKSWNDGALNCLRMRGLQANRHLRFTAQLGSDRVRSSGSEFGPLR